MPTRPPAPPHNATDLLDQQLQLLKGIQQLQKKQVEILEQLKGQPANGLPQGSSRAGLVKIVDFNMPFWALTGMLVKISLAAIPAAIIITVVSGVLVFGMGIVFSTLGALLSLPGR